MKVVQTADTKDTEKDDNGKSTPDQPDPNQEKKGGKSNDVIMVAIQVETAHCKKLYDKHNTAQTEANVTRKYVKHGKLMK